MHRSKSGSAFYNVYYSCVGCTFGLNKDQNVEICHYYDNKIIQYTSMQKKELYWKSAFTVKRPYIREVLYNSHNLPTKPRFHISPNQWVRKLIGALLVVLLIFIPGMVTSAKGYKHYDGEVI